MIKFSEINFMDVYQDGKNYLRGSCEGISVDVEMVETELPIDDGLTVALAKDFLRDALDRRLNVLKMVR